MGFCCGEGFAVVLHALIGDKMYVVATCAEYFCKSLRGEQVTARAACGEGYEVFCGWGHCRYGKKCIGHKLSSFRKFGR
jgi:hypothetical protein